MTRARCGEALVLALLLAPGCDDDVFAVVPVIDVPIDDSDALAAPLDQITVSVARSGSDRDLKSQSFARGAPIEMPDIPFGEDLVLHMSGFVGSSNVAYGRACPFTVAPGVRTPSPHLFFSRTVKFASLGIAPAPRIGGFGIDYVGSGLFVGGVDGTGAPVATVERFDALTGQLTVLGEVSPREGAVQALIGTSPPRVMVVGGASGSDSAKFVELLDADRIERLEFAEMARVDLTTTTLIDGRVIAIGGREPGGPPSGDIDMVAVDGPSLDVRKLSTATLMFPRSGHTATRLGDDVGAPVLVVGGLDADGHTIAPIELFKPLNEELANGTPSSLAFPRYRHAAALMPDGSVLVIGGITDTNLPVRTLELLSFDTGFVSVGDLPAGAGVVEMTATTLPDGRILITGGRLAPDGPPLNSAYIARLDPLDGRVDVVATDRLAVARAGHQAMVLCDGTVLISGGTAAQVPAERYNPPPFGRR